MAEHMLAHLQDRSSPSRGSSRSHQDTGGIEITSSLLTIIVVEISSENSLFAGRPSSVIGNDIREDSIAVGIRVVPHLGITEIDRCGSNLPLLSILPYGIHDDTFVRLSRFLISNERTESSLHVHFLPLVVIDGSRSCA